jgi:hypothetical protein
VNWKKYGIYHARWQLSTVVMSAPLYVLTDVVGLMSVVALPIVQFLGACVFWYVDGWIFDEENS